MAEKPHQPPRTLLRWFANDLATALAGKHVTNEKLFVTNEKRFRQLAGDIQKTLQSAGTSTSGFHETVSHAETVLISLGLNTAQSQSLARKLKAVGDKVRGPEDIPVMDARCPPPHVWRGGGEPGSLRARGGGCLTST